MTPQEFIETIKLPEDRLRVAVVTTMPMVYVANWLQAVKTAAGERYDRWQFQPSPMRLFGFIDGVREPRLSLVVYDAWRHEKIEGAQPDRVIEDIEL